MTRERSSLAQALSEGEFSYDSALSELLKSRRASSHRHSQPSRLDGASRVHHASGDAMAAEPAPLRPHSFAGDPALFGRLLSKSTEEAAVEVRLSRMMHGSLSRFDEEEPSYGAWGSFHPSGVAVAPSDGRPISTGLDALHRCPTSSTRISRPVQVEL